MSEPQSFAELMRRTGTPRLVRVLARLVFAAFLATPFILAFVPWQQTVMGRGTVVAYSPVERMQVITARVSGQVKRWHVVEGSRVKINDPLVDIEDNDSELEARLAAHIIQLQIKHLWHTDTTVSKKNGSSIVFPNILS